MGVRELIEALRRDGEEKAGSIRTEAGAEVEKIRGEEAAGIEALRVEYGMRGSAAAAEVTRAILAEAESRARSIRSEAESRIAERLFRLASRSLTLLRDDTYGEIFSALVSELPPHPWERVRVHPDDREMAAKAFPGAEIITDGTISGGVDAEWREGRIRVINTFEKRLEKGWGDLLPALMEDIRRETEGHETSSHP